MTAGHTLERSITPEGHELALVGRGDDYEIIYDGQFLMSSASRRSEKALAELGLAPLGRDDMTVLVAGLGMGFTLRAVLDTPGVARVDVVEISSTVVEWNHKYFGSLTGNAVADPRVHLHVADLLTFEKRIRYQPLEELPAGWLALLLDVDNGPTWLSRPENRALYTDDGLRRLIMLLRHGGVLGIWSAQRDLELVARMNTLLVNVAELAVPVEINDRASLDYIYRGRRPADRPPGARVARA